MVNLDRREQFNFRTSFLSDRAYQYLLQLSQSKQLSAQIARWAEEHLQATCDSIKNHSQPELRDVLRGIEDIKRLLGGQLTHSKTRPQNLEHQEQVTLISSERTNSIIDDDEVNYNY